jgi:hypothetical protein
MTNAFKYLASVLFVAIVVQVALAGYGVFYALHTAKHTHPATEKTFDHGFGPHAALGSVIAILIVVLLIVAAAGRLGRPAIQRSFGLLVLAVIQFPFAELGRSVPAIGFLHTVTALALFGATAVLARYVWRQPGPQAAA